MRYDNAHITEIAGYHLTDRIGSGGMGDVYKAYNQSLKRMAAVKILHQKEMAERFRNEAYIQSSVSHPNIACLYEYVVSGETPCIIMEYVEGESLDTFLHKRGRLSSDETENIIRQVASALAYLHKKDILHRDVKPQNFKIHGGKVTMLDFGIAKNKYTPKLTQQGFVVGTTEYMSPEQFQQQVEKKSDVWSLGVMTYELLTGYLPFEANNPVTLRSKIEKGGFTDPKIMVPELSDKLKLIIEKCLRINPASRISAAEIEKLLEDRQQSGNAEKSVLTSLPFSVTRKMTGIAAGLILLIIAIIFFTSNSKQDNDVTGNDNGINVAGKKNETTSRLQKLTINVSSPLNAEIVLTDGSRHPLPFDTTGKEGDKLEFTLEADGYVSRKVTGMEFTTRGYYNYNLEKK
jgi:eukaryotic-like serine/threonine-protein kinase